MKYHYLDANNEKAGPATLDEIRTLAEAGKIPADPQICPEDAEETWKALSVQTSQTSPETEKPADKSSSAGKLPFAGTILADWVGKLLGLIRGFLSPVLIEKSLGMAKHFGQYAVLFGGVLGFIAAIVAAIRLNSFAVFLGGLGFIIALAVAQFAAVKFLDASDNLIGSTPSRLSSMAFLDCVGLLSILGAVILLIGGIVGAIQTGGITLLIMGLVVSILLTFFAAVALHPKLASVDSGTGSAGEEAIGILAFFLKGALKLVPLVFLLFSVVGALLLLVGMFAPRSEFVIMLQMMLPTIPVPGLGAPGLAGLGVVLTATLLPIIAYVLFLIALLPLELWRAILSLPGKLDQLGKG